MKYIGVLCVLFVAAGSCERPKEAPEGFEYSDFSLPAGERFGIHDACSDVRAVDPTEGLPRVLKHDFVADPAFVSP